MASTEDRSAVDFATVDERRAHLNFFRDDCKCHNATFIFFGKLL